MFERDKINESEYFYQKIVSEQSDYPHFRYNLSAFLSSTRSVMQYLCKEAKTHKGGQKWYDTNVNKSPILKHFKEKRNNNIHEEPVKPSIHVTLYAPCVRIIVTGPETQSLEEKQSNAVKIGQATQKALSVQEISKEEKELINRSTIDHVTGISEKASETIFKFDDWNGSEDVLQLCQIYLDEVKSMVQKAKNDGIITH